jgi:hypothetical protein
MVSCVAVQTVNWTYQIFGEISYDTLWLNALHMEAITRPSTHENGVTFQKIHYFVSLSLLNLQ